MSTPLREAALLYPLTEYGTVLSHDEADGELSHRPLPEAHEAAPPLALPSALPLQVRLKEYLANTEAALKAADGEFGRAGWTQGPSPR